MPIEARNTNGISQLSRKITIAAHASKTAIPTYTGSSSSQRSLRSVTSADMPETKHWLPHTERICLIASMVTSAEVALSKNTATRVESPLLNSLYILSGSSSLGIVISAREEYQSTVSTCSTCLIRSQRLSTSRSDIPSTTMNENAPLPKSSIRSFCPMTVSISSGR